MSAKRLPSLVLLSICCGMVVSWIYVNPYTKEITLTELTLQLSGSRGTFPLWFSLPELLSFSMKLIPEFLFELYIGTNLYRHFCTASVYVFSRTANRLRWYGRECLVIFGEAVLYQSVYLAVVIAVACCRYAVVWDGWPVLVLHAVLHILWLFATTLLVNVLAIQMGSGGAFGAVLGGQLVLITLLALQKLLEPNPDVFTIAIRLNPMAHLVLGWQSSSLAGLNVALHAPWDILPLGGSLAYTAAVSLLALTTGGLLVRNHDLIIADCEFGGN